MNPRSAFMTFSQRLRYSAWALVCFGSLSTTVLHAGEIITNPDQQIGLAVTIYNSGLALVKDRRDIALPSGESALAFRGVSARIQPETVLFGSQSAPGSIAVIEQNFDYDLLSPQSLLDAYLGQAVNIITTNPATGEESVEEATVLATPGKTGGGTVLKIGNRIETGVPGRLVFPEVPENFRDQPTLVLQLDNQHRDAQTVELSYLTQGMGWEANYVAQLSADETMLDLNGWVTLNNQSGAAYQNAQLQLVAGDVNVVHEERAMMADSMVRREQASAAPEFSNEALYDYHLYTLDRPTTLANKQTKQLALLNASQVAVDKRYVLRGNNWWYQTRQAGAPRAEKVRTELRFKNSETNQLGKPLPKGTIRLYKNDLAGGAQFIGEDRIDHTAENQTVMLSPGTAFDLTAMRSQQRFRRATPRDQSVTIMETDTRITLANAKDKAVRVRVEEPIPGKWRIIDGQKPDSREGGVGVWQVSVPAKGEASLRFVVEAQL